MWKVVEVTVRQSQDRNIEAFIAAMCGGLRPVTVCDGGRDGSVRATPGWLAAVYLSRDVRCAE